MKALIVDDHPIARRGLAAILRNDVGVDDIVEANTATDALALAHEHQPALVLMDMRMPGSLPPRQLCEQLRAALPAARVVLVTAFDRPSDIRDCLEAGANGCVLKDTSDIDVAAAFERILAGETVIDPRIAQGLAATFVGGANARTTRLTGREREVLQLLAEGSSNRQIADRLIISETTVKGYVSNLLEKLDASSRLEAVVRAGQTGLL